MISVEHFENASVLEWIELIYTSHLMKIRIITNLIHKDCRSYKFFIIYNIYTFVINNSKKLQIFNLIYRKQSRYYNNILIIEILLQYNN